MRAGHLAWCAGRGFPVAACLFPQHMPSQPSQVGAGAGLTAATPFPVQLGLPVLGVVVEEKAAEAMVAVARPSRPSSRCWPLPGTTPLLLQPHCRCVWCGTLPTMLCPPPSSPSTHTCMPLIAAFSPPHCGWFRQRPQRSVQGWPQRWAWRWWQQQAWRQRCRACPCHGHGPPRARCTSPAAPPICPSGSQPPAVPPPPSGALQQVRHISPRPPPP